VLRLYLVIKIGTDICSLKRIGDAYARFGEKFLAKILTDNEIRYVVSEPPHTVTRLAGRFAAKEAASKALGTGWHGVGWKEVEIVRMPSGEPTIRLHGRAQAIAERRGLAEWQVSISHEREFAVAMVLAHSGNV
jgi:holo-[acyl-carrier protein] synthase